MYLSGTRTWDATSARRRMRGILNASSVTLAPEEVLNPYWLGVMPEEVRIGLEASRLTT